MRRDISISKDQTLAPPRGSADLELNQRVRSACEGRPGAHICQTGLKPGEAGTRSPPYFMVFHHLYRDLPAGHSSVRLHAKGFSTRGRPSRFCGGMKEVSRGFICILQDQGLVWRSMSLRPGYIDIKKHEGIEALRL
ncbi:hypothetical protein PBY51_015554 [Eleginops maclovinus]|uniref:Uncharacterized protein n=1 Tax=Eleginops maclovinus TaxID=56733 RepID=A0AAN7XNT0_ELEMC|nr:hypothetical protein PBY51_015554 [Eleginops maclovinus]